jgi:uncharacterized protein YggE
MRQNAEQMTRVLAAIKAAGIPDKDVQTSGIHLNPQYRYADNQPPKIAGYQASNTVSLKVRDIASSARCSMPGRAGRQPDQRPQLRDRPARAGL